MKKFLLIACFISNLLALETDYLIFKNCSPYEITIEEIYQQPSESSIFIISAKEQIKRSYKQRPVSWHVSMNNIPDTTHPELTKSIVVDLNFVNLDGSPVSERAILFDYDAITESMPSVVQALTIEEQRELQQN